MADASRSDIFTLIRNDPDRLLAEIAETLGAVVGEACSLAADDGRDAHAPFSATGCWVITWHAPGDDGPEGLVALDAPAVIRAGGALAMLPSDAISAALASGEVPEKMAASLPGIGNLLVGALAKLCGGTELAAGDAEARDAGPWPAVVAGAGENAAHLCARLAVGDEQNAGTLLVVSTPTPGSEGDAGEPLSAGRVQNLDGMTVRMVGRPGDPAQVALADVVEALGGRVLQMHQNSLLADPPAAVFVVSRSPSDLRARMETIAADDERPALVVACSDRPTRDLVLTARQSGASDFLVLPTTRERLVAVLAKALQPA